MKLSFGSLIVAPLAASALAFPQWSGWPWPAEQCISLSLAETIVGYYAAVLAHEGTALGNATQTALAITATNYTEQSDSANEQIGIPLGALTTPSQAAFAVESQENPAAVFTTLGIYTVECNSILWRWVEYGDGGNATALEVKGFHLFELNSQNLLQTTYFEFNGLAAAIDTHLYGCTK